MPKTLCAELCAGVMYTKKRLLLQHDNYLAPITAFFEVRPNLEKQVPFGTPVVGKRNTPDELSRKGKPLYMVSYRKERKGLRRWDRNNSTVKV
jgi:hypothetical protein